MKQSLIEHIEAKIINLLHDVKNPIHASQIAVQIQERREDTIFAIQKLVGNHTIRGIQDFAYFNTTGETMAYTLAGGAVQQTPADPAVPIPPPQPASPSSRHPEMGGSAYK